MPFKKELSRTQPDHKRQVQKVLPPDYRSLEEVYITRDMGAKTNEKLIAFINGHIAEYGGQAKEQHGIPLMLFEKKQDAHKFADKLSAHLDIPREHIAVKAQKYTR